MMGHETMPMIYEKYYSYIKSYEREEGSAFMQNVYGPAVPAVKEEQSEASLPLRF
jgi:integrase